MISVGVIKVRECGKVYATMTIEVVELMMCKRGDKKAAKGYYGWFNGYQLTGA